MSDFSVFEHTINNALHISLKDIYHNLLESHYGNTLTKEEVPYLKILYHFYSKKELYFKILKENRLGFEGKIHGFNAILHKSHSCIPLNFDPKNDMLLVNIHLLNMKNKTIFLSRLDMMELNLDFKPKVTYDENSNKEELEQIAKSKKFFKIYDLTKDDPLDFSTPYEDIIMHAITSGEGDKFGY